MEALARELGAEGESLLTCARRSARELEAMDLSGLSVTVVHADYRMANILYDGDKVAAVFDFDTAFHGPRLLDMGRLLIAPGRGLKSLRVEIKDAVSALQAYDQAAPFSDAEWDALPAFLRWRWVRDPIVYYDQFWLAIRDIALALFDGAAEEIVRAARHGMSGGPK